MGLGLIVGIAALGVISARAVVERTGAADRDPSALGFRRRMIQVSFLIESSFIALTAIVVGTLLALIIAVNIIDDVGSQSSWNDLAIVVPWANLDYFRVVYLAACSPRCRRLRARVQDLSGGGAPAWRAPRRRGAVLAAVTEQQPPQPRPGNGARARPRPRGAGRGHLRRCRI